MAYSNWGAFVYRGDKRRRDCEDVPVFGDRSNEIAAPSGARIFVNLLKLRDAGKMEDSPWWQHAHHAVLGDGPVRLCGYKSRPELWVLRDEAPTKIEIEWDPYDDDWALSHPVVAGEVDGYRWEAMAEEEPESVHLVLIEPDGTTWRSHCGYCIGAGHQDDPDPPDGPEVVP